MKATQIIVLFLLATIAYQTSYGSFQEKVFDPNDKHDALALKTIVSQQNLEVVNVISNLKQF